MLKVQYLSFDYPDWDKEIKKLIIYKYKKNYATKDWFSLNRNIIIDWITKTLRRDQHKISKSHFIKARQTNISLQ